MRKTNPLSAVIVAFLLAVSLRAQTSEDYNFLTGLPDFARLKNMLPEYLIRIALAQLEERQNQVARFSSPEDVLKRKSYLRERMLRRSEERRVGKEWST